MAYSTTSTLTTQLHLAMRAGADSTAAGLWYMQNGLQLNPNKSEALVVGMSPQLTMVYRAICDGRWR